MVLIYRNAFRYFAMGYAAAQSVGPVFRVVALLTLLIFRTSRHWVYYEGGDHEPGRAPIRRPRPRRRRTDRRADVARRGAVRRVLPRSASTPAAGSVGRLSGAVLLDGHLGSERQRADFRSDADVGGRIPSIGTIPAKRSIIPGFPICACSGTASITPVRSPSALCLSCAAVGYGFARLRFPGRDALFAITLATLMIPADRHLHPDLHPLRQGSI